jgi:hypothetical protein
MERPATEDNPNQKIRDSQNELDHAEPPRREDGWQDADEGPQNHPLPGVGFREQNQRKDVFEVGMRVTPSREPTSVWVPSVQ